MRSLGLISAISAAILLVGCGGDPPDKDKDDPAAGREKPASGGVVALQVDFEQLPPDGAPMTSLKSTEGDARIEVVTSGSGAVLAVPDTTGGTAAQFPDNAQVVAGGLAVLNVTPTGEDTLAPGDEDFQFGVDVMYPEGAAGDSAGDNGDNLMQRGLFGDQGQYKLQVDHERPACRIAGERDEVLVKSERTLESGQWYRLLCQRADDRVTLFVAEIEEPEDGPIDDDDRDWRSWTTTDRTGPIPAGPTPAPMSVGGKLNPQGGIVADAPDQFSGVLDNVVFRSLPS